MAPSHAVLGEAVLGSSCIHPWARALASPAPTGLLNRSSKFSVPSAMPSSAMGTDTVAYRAPAGIVSVPDVAV